MRLMASEIRISLAKFHCSRLKTVQDIQDYASLIFGTQCSLVVSSVNVVSPARRKYTVDVIVQCLCKRRSRC